MPIPVINAQKYPELKSHIENAIKIYLTPTNQYKPNQEGRRRADTFTQAIQNFSDDSTKSQLGIFIVLCAIYRPDKYFHIGDSKQFAMLIAKTLLTGNLSHGAYGQGPARFMGSINSEFFNQENLDAVTTNLKNFKFRTETQSTFNKRKAVRHLLEIALDNLPRAAKLFVIQTVKDLCKICKNPEKDISNWSFLTNNAATDAIVTEISNTPTAPATASTSGMASVSRATDLCRDAFTGPQQGNDADLKL